MNGTRWAFLVGPVMLATLGCGVGTIAALPAAPFTDGGVTAGTPADGGAKGIDAGTPADGGVAGTDAGTPADGGMAEIDAGTPSDGGMEETDAGTPSDGGMAETDAGTPADGGVAADPPVFGSAPAPEGYTLSWSDEFNGTALDTTKWNALENANYGSSNHEDECYFGRNVTEGGGSLKLTAKRESVVCGGKNPDGPDNGYSFTSGFITTRAQGGAMKYKFRYGYAEASIRMPKGNPFWGAFWLVGPGDGSTPGWPDYGEFDVTEIVGGRPDVTHGTFHYACDGASNCHTSAGNLYNLATGDSLSASSNLGPMLTQDNFDTFDGVTSSRFVRYGFLWEPHRITWYVDGNPVRYFDGTHLVRIKPDGSEQLEKTVGVDLYPNNPPSIDFDTVFAYEHSIDLNLAFGGAMTTGTNGYTGNDLATGGYSDGSLVANLPGAMEIDYVRVYQRP